MPKLDEYVQIMEAAEILGVCRNTLRNWGRNGKIPEYRHPINGYRLYRKQDLELLISQIEKQPIRKPR